MLFCQLCDDSGEGKEGDKVGDGHKSVEGVGKVPYHLNGGGGTDDYHSGEDELIYLGDLSAEKVFHATRAVKGPTEDGGEGKEEKCDGNKQRGKLIAEYRCESAGNKLGAYGLSEINGNTACDDGKTRKGADYESICKDLVDTVKSLLNGCVYIL